MCNLIFMTNTWFTRFIFWLVRYISSLALFCREIFALFLNFLLFFLRVCEWCRENKKLNFFFLTLLRTACNLNEISWHLLLLYERAMSPNLGTFLEEYKAVMLKKASTIQYLTLSYISTVSVSYLVYSVNTRHSPL